MNNLFKRSFIILSFIVMASHAYAATYDEHRCYKDYVVINGEETMLAVNKDTNLIELYWSAKDGAWLAPDETYREDLQKIFNKKIQLREMQIRLDQMYGDAWLKTEE